MKTALSEKAEKLLNAIPLGGGFVGNTTLQRTSGLAGDEYWDTRRELLNSDLIILGKGKGGSIARKPSGSDAAEAPLKPSEKLVEEERELYEPLKKWLEDNWGRSVQEEGDFFIAKITATPKNRPRPARSI